MNETHESVAGLGAKTVEVAFTDLLGALRGKRVPARAFEAGHHVAVSCAAFAWDFAAELLPDDSINWATGYPDLFLRPDMATLRPLGWRPGSVMVTCDVEDQEGAPVEYSPRHVLRRAVEACRKAGFEGRIGLETEFYVLDPATRLPVPGRNPCYSLHGDSHLEPMLDEIRTSLAAAGIEVEASGAEYAVGQVEINCRYRDPLAAADELVFFRYAVKQTAARHGRLATFMAKPFDHCSGSGLHVHQSLWHARSGENAFWDTDRRRLSGTAEAYLAGLLRHAVETHAVAVPTPNGYKRMAEYSFAPTTVSWAVDNRCAAVRAIPHGASATRLEYRVAASDANPYLLVACALMAGLAGVREGLRPGPPAGDAYREGGCEPLPASPAEGLRRLGESAFAREVLGAKTVDLLLALGARENERYGAQVGDWERTRYLDAV